MNSKTLRSTTLAAAALVTALAALAQPQIAVAGEAALSTSIQPVQRFRAADNGSAEVRVAAPVAGGAVVEKALVDGDAVTADKRIKSDFTADKRIKSDFTADKRIKSDFTADKRIKSDFTADKRIKSDFTADKRVKLDFTADKRVQHD